MFARITLLLIIFVNVKSNEHKGELGYENEPVEDVYFWRMYHDSPVNKREAILTSQNKTEGIKIQGSENVQINTNVSQAKLNDDSKLTPENNDGVVKPSSPVPLNSTVKSDVNIQTKNNITDPPKETAFLNSSTQIAPSAIKSETSTPKPIDAVTTSPLNSPGVVKRGLIVFGGFALLAVAYLIFYRRKGKNYDSNNLHNNNDTNQFRYGVLQSEDGRDNLELSRIPLTMESDDDEEDDLEIFDLEQKKKSLSYVNLQVNDEDIVFHNRKDESKNNLLLDIEDGPSDMINWSSTSNKSIL